VNFTPDMQGIGEILAGFQPQLHEVATAIVGDAKGSLSGVRADVVNAITVGAFRVTSEGAEQEVDWDSPFWHFFEFGNQHHPPYRSLTRAAQNQGLKITDRGRH
jgi:hypothetical protein